MPTQSHFVKYKWAAILGRLPDLSGSLRTKATQGCGQAARTSEGAAESVRRPNLQPSSTQVPELSLPNWPLSGDSSRRGNRNRIDLDLELWPGERLNTNQSTGRQGSVAKVLPEHCVNHSDLFLFKADDVNSELRHVCH